MERLAPPRDPPRHRLVQVPLKSGKTGQHLFSHFGGEWDEMFKKR